jgi:hypothetical protein
VIDLAATDDFLDLARGAASIVHKNALAAGQRAVARLVLQNLRMGLAASQHEQKGHYDRDLKFVHESMMHRETEIFQSAIRTVAQESELTGTNRAGFDQINESIYNGFSHEEAFMRKVVLALLAASGFALTHTAPAEAVGTRHPFCLQGREHPALSDCTWDSYEQCQATASGQRLYCIQNPFFVAGGDPRAYRSRHRVPRGGYYSPYY